MPHFGINQLFLSPLKVCDLLRNCCAIYPGITVRFAPELLCDLPRILHDISFEEYQKASSIFFKQTIYELGEAKSIALKSLLQAIKALRLALTVAFGDD